MVCGAVQWWYSWTGNPDDQNRDLVVAANIQSDALVEPPRLLATLLRRETVITTPGLIRRNAIEKAGGFEEGFHGLYEDQAFCAKLCSQSPVFVARRCWYRWRKHPDSCCSVAVGTGRYHNARLAFLRWLKNYLREQGIDHGELREILEQELCQCEHRLSTGLGSSLRPLGKRMGKLGKRAARRTLPHGVQSWLRARLRPAEYRPAVGRVNFGSLRRLRPVSEVFGFDRGLPVDRYYIERFLSTYAADIRGHVLEIGDATYTKKYGRDKVAESDVLHVVEGNPQATIVADLSCAESIPDATFDCIICTQTLMFIYDVRATMRSLYRILKPGGVLLATMAGVSHQISRYDMIRWGDYWRFTSLSARLLFEEIFPKSNIRVRTYGNVLTATSLLQGLVTEDLKPEELDRYDANYEVSIAVRAMKPESVR